MPILRISTKINESSLYFCINHITQHNTGSNIFSRTFRSHFPIPGLFKRFPGARSPCIKHRMTVDSTRQKTRHFVEFGDGHAEHLGQLWWRAQSLKTRVEVRNQIDGERLTHASEMILFLRRECAFVNSLTQTQQQLASCLNYAWKLEYWCIEYLIFDLIR